MSVAQSPLQIRRWASLTLSLAAVGGPAAAGAQGTEQGAYIVRIGKDTLAAERFSRTPTALRGESVVRSPQTVVRSYALTFDANGNLLKYELTARKPGAPPSSRPLQHAILTPIGDSLRVEIHTDSARTMMVAAPRGTLPALNLAYGIYETAVMRAVKMGKDSVVIPMLFIGSNQTNDIPIKRIGKDSITLAAPFGVSRMRIDAVGHIMGSASPGSTQQVTVERVNSVDPQALALAFGDRGLGPLSPRDTARATVAGTTLLVDYSRPMKRGRVVFGNVVPWDSVWRTGANAATTFVTSKDIVLGGASVPAGTYTLFTLPTQGAGWKLIISRHTKEWGTDYDPKGDLARVDLKVVTLPAPVEQLTFAIDTQGSGGTLRFSWDETEARVPFEVKP